MQELLALRTKYAESGVQTALSYSRTLYDLASEAQAEYSSMAEAGVGELHQGRRDDRRQGEQVGPGRLGRRGSTRSSRTFAASTAAFDQFQKATKQVVNLADASVRAAAANASKATTKGRKHA